MPPLATISVVLHAHLPFVRHPEHDDFLEEDWLYEAITETYAPLLLAMERLDADGVPWQLAMSLSPTLCAMLDDALLLGRYRRWLEARLELAGEEAVRRRGTPFEDAAADLHRTLREVHEAVFGRWGGKLLPAFRRLGDTGNLEILTVGATHGLLPLMVTDEARRAQVEVAVAEHRRHFGRPPRGIWLPESGWAPGLDALLAEAGLRFFFVETRALLEASPPARLGPWRPVITPRGLAAFARDPESAHQVWSARGGYPGDPAYREFYRDLGYDLPYERVRPYLHSDGVRRNLGLKLHRVTGPVPLHAKEPYVPAWAAARAAEHARDFLRRKVEQARRLAPVLGAPPHLTAPFDAELFGHWWYEGPRFLEAFFREAARQDAVRPVTPGRYLAAERVHQLAVPAASTWGDQGTFAVWLGEANRWIYPPLHRAEERMAALVARHGAADGLLRRALAQAGRELLLAQASDWAFIMTMGTTVPYAWKRTREHLLRFERLAAAVEAGRVDEAELAAIEARDNLFPHLDPRAWRPVDAPTGMATTLRATRA